MAKHILFWVIIFVCSFSVVAALRAFESPKFKLAQMQQTDTKKEKGDSERKTKSEIGNNAEKEAKSMETPSEGMMEDDESVNKSALESEENKQTSITCNDLLADKKRYKQVMMLVGKYYRKEKMCKTLKTKLSQDEILLIQDTFEYCKENNDLPKEMQDSFTEFCKADEYNNMDLDCDDNKFYHEVSKGFQISWNYTNNRPNFYISLYDISLGKHQKITR